MSTNISDDIELLVMRALCKHQRSSYSHHVLKALSEDPKRVSDLELNVHGYNSSADFADSYLLYSFLRKWVGFDIDKKSLETKTARIWQDAEHQCFSTNARLRRDLELGLAPQNLIISIQRKIVQVIGNAPTKRLLDNCRWSGGATFDKRRGSLIQDKICSDLSCTSDFAETFTSDVFDDLWKSLGVGLSSVRGNRCVQVPKTAKVNRMIAAEPTANAFAQQSVGAFIRRSLLAFGVDLNDQTVNQGYAFKALIDGLATIDLSSASDTLSRNLVELLLPPEWYDLLDAMRSKYSYLNGKWHQLEKFSSMGNAFTFELESLIFWAICSAVSDLCNPSDGDLVVSVYGDDIIIDQKVEKDVVGALQYFGFSVNTEKSYFSGSRFFESCGRHYFDLEDVTPVYQKTRVGSDLFEIIALHNRLCRWFKRNPRSYSKKILDLILSFASQKHPKLKEFPRTPFITSDMGFITEGLKTNKNGDFKCFVLMLKTEPQYNIVDLHERGIYAYKLRRGSLHLNGTPEGYVSDVVFERRVLTNTVIWRSQLA